MRTPKTTLGGRFSIGTAVLAAGFGVFALTCGRTPLFRCDLVGCAQPSICVDAGHSQGDAGSDMFCCVNPVASTCLGEGESCGGVCGNNCCAGTTCSNSFCVTPTTPDSGSCIAAGGSCASNPTNCCTGQCTIQTPSGNDVCVGSCLEDGASCTVGSQCCSTSCITTTGSSGPGTCAQQ